MFVKPCHTVSKLYTHEETGNPVTLVQQSHSLDPAVLDQCSVCPWKSSDDTRPEEKVRVMHATMAAFGLYHHHVFMLLWMFLSSPQRQH